MPSPTAPARGGNDRSGCRYHSYLKSISARSLFSEIIAYLTLGVAAYATAVSCAYTLAEVYRGKFFVSLQPYTPLAVMKLTHDAIRGAEARLRALGEAADAAGPKSDAYAQLLVEAGVFVKLMWEHSKHEDTIVFKEVRRFSFTRPISERQAPASLVPIQTRGCLVAPVSQSSSRGRMQVDNMVPGAQEEYEHEHEELHASLDELEAAIKAGKGVTRALGKAFDLTLPHLLHEEENIQQILRKTVPLPLAKDLVRRVWASTDARAWMEIVPWVVNNLPREEQRIKYCRAWMDAMPERCHQIGRFVYLGVAPSTWAVLRMHVPEMIPRGLKGFTHVW